MNLTTRKTTGLLLAVVACAGCASLATSANRIASQQDRAYSLTAGGELARPTGYRTWVYVGTPVTPNDMNNGKAAFPEHHNVYIDPASYEHYLETGVWREGTILVKELVSVGSKRAVSGNGYFQGEFIGLEATIKSEQHFPDEPGNWAYFSFTNHDDPAGPLKASAEPFPAASCNACHEASAQDDFVFTQYYPVLRAAKNARHTPEDRATRPKTLGMGDGATGGGTLQFDQSSRDETWRATSSTPAAIAGTDVPVDQSELFDYLRGGRYRAWETKERAMHPSAGPHTNFGKPVRVFMNDTLAESMRAGHRAHPEGATAVKEMFDDDGTLAGWAVSTKTGEDSKAGEGWFWYEVTSVEDGSDPVAIGNGVPGCYGCHARGGQDFVLTSLPQP